MKIALVHDYLREYGGAERVLEVLHEIWPDAPLYTSFVDWRALGDQAVRFKAWDIRPSWVQHNPIVKKFHSPLRFLAPRIWESFDLSEFDVVLSSCGWFMCRGVLTSTSAVHICYIHHPPRNLYGYDTGSLVQKYPLVKVYANIINFFLRHYDYETAQRVNFFIANSKETAKRVKKFYRRDSTVIYPPVENSYTPVKSKPEYYLSVGRLTYAKRIDIIIQACNELKLPLKIVGTGKEGKALRQIAGPTIEFVGSVSDNELSVYYSRAKALIFCARDEDFGIVPVEAMGHGVPVIALKEGGVKETVIHGKTGILFDTPTSDALVEAIKQFTKLKVSWSSQCIRQAEQFSKKYFTHSIKQFVSSVVNKKPSQE